MELTGREAFGHGGLEGSLARSREDWGIDDLADLFRDGRARGLSLMHVGGDGWLKRLDFMPHDEGRLRRICEAGERADGSSLFPGSGIPAGASDIVLRPRIESAFLDPFSEVPTLVLMCSHSGPDGNPLPQSPDTIVRRAMDRLREQTGIELLALGEVEYFLGKRRDESDIYGADDRGYHAVSPFVFGEPLRRRAL
nr:glutamine synthetase [Candidatus Palauibacterales bacterium]